MVDLLWMVKCTVMQEQQGENQHGHSSASQFRNFDILKDSAALELGCSIYVQCSKSGHEGNTFTDTANGHDGQTETSMTIINNVCSHVL